MTATAVTYLGNGDGTDENPGSFIGIDVEGVTFPRGREVEVDDSKVVAAVRKLDGDDEAAGGPHQFKVGKATAKPDQDDGDAGGDAPPDA